MDRLSLAEAALAAAARHGGVVVPDHVTSPMDCCHTVPVARSVVDGCSDRARQEMAGRGGTGADALTVELVAGDDPESNRALLDPEMVRLAGGQPAPEAATRSDGILSA
jgi:hypothetical protein